MVQRNHLTFSIFDRLTFQLSPGLRGLTVAIIAIHRRIHQFRQILPPTQSSVVEFAGGNSFSDEPGVAGRYRPRVKMTHSSITG